MKKTVWLALFVLTAAVLLGMYGCSGGTGAVVDVPAPTPAGALPGPGGNTSTPDLALPGTSPQGSPTPEVTHHYDPNELDGTEDPAKTPVPDYTYEQAKNLNSDVIGWISVPNTKVNYPVVQTGNNEYYLTRAVDKTDSKGGAIFLDYRCKTEGKHLILFGHNMRQSGTMFAGINNYSESSFYKNNREFTITFGSTKHTYRVFSVYTMDASAAQEKRVHAVDENFPDHDSFATHMNDLAKLSKYTPDITVGPEDVVVTLITCNRSDYQNGRFFVHAVKVS